MGGPEKPIILLVEDDTSILRLLASCLESRYAVLPVAHGSEAFQILSESPRIDLLLTDVQLPGVNGIELADEFRSRWPRGPVILISGSNIEPHENSYLTLQKPFHLGELTTLIEELLRLPVCRVGPIEG